MLHQQHNLFHAHKPRCHQPVHGTSKWTPYTQQSNLLLRYLFQIKATFSDATTYKGERFKKESVCYLRTHFKPTETFQYTFYTTCHSLEQMASMIVERYDSSGLILQNKNSFKTNLAERGREKPSEKRIWLHSQKWSFKDVNGLSSRKNISTIESCPIIRHIPTVRNLKEILMSKCLLIQQRPLLREIFKEPII